MSKLELNPEDRERYEKVKATRGSRREAKMTRVGVGSPLGLSAREIAGPVKVRLGPLTRIEEEQDYPQLEGEV